MSQMKQSPIEIVQTYHTQQYWSHTPLTILFSIGIHVLMNDVKHNKLYYIIVILKPMKFNRIFHWYFIHSFTIFEVFRLQFTIPFQIINREFVPYALNPDTNVKSSIPNRNVNPPNTFIWNACRTKIPCSSW